MKRIRFDDVVKRANTKEDRFHTSRLYYVGGEHIDSEDPVVHNRGLIAGSTIGPMFYFGFKKGQILFVSRNPHLRKCAQVDFNGICSEKTFVLETKDENVLLQKYLVWVMQTNDFWDYCEENKSGSINFFINWSTLADYEFDLPDIEEQKRIADLLWAAYDLKESYKRVLTASDELAKSRFVEMFGDQKTNPYGFPTATLGETCTFYPGTGFPTKYQGNSSGMYPFFKVGDISRNILAGNTRLVDAENYINADVVNNINGVIIPSGTVVFAKIGETIRLNRKAITTQNCLVDNNVMGIKPKGEELTNEYFLQFMIGLNMNEFAGATALPSIRKSSLEKVQILVPDMVIQMRYAEFAHRLGESKAALQKCIKSLDDTIKTFLNKNISEEEEGNNV